MKATKYVQVATGDRRRVDASHVALLTRQLALMMSSGVELTRALETLEMAEQDATVAGILRAVRLRLLQGNLFSRGLAEHPRMFAPVYVALVRVGEHTGGLVRVLERLADWLERENRLRRRVQAALIYPFIVLSMSVLLLVTIFVTLVPGLMQVLESDPDSRLLAFLRLATTPVSWIFPLSFVLVTAVFLKERVDTESGRRQLFELGLRLPGLREVLNYGALTRLCTSASLLFEVGVDAVKSLRLAAATTHHPLLQDEMERVVSGMIEGELLSDMLRQVSIAPPVFRQMVEVGEESARLPDIFLRLGAHFETDLGYRIDGMLALLEPLLIALLAGLVGFTAVSVLVPLYGTLMNLS